MKDTINVLGQCYYYQKNKNGGWFVINLNCSPIAIKDEDIIYVLDNYNDDFNEDDEECIIDLVIDDDDMIILRGKK